MTRAILVLAACSSPSTPAITNSAPLPATAYTVDGTHVGPVTAATRVSVAAARRLFPGADVRPSTLTMYEHPVNVVEIRLHGRAEPSLILVALTSPALIFADPTGHTPDELRSVRILDPAFRPDPRWGLGIRRHALEAILGPLNCYPMDADHDAGKLACPPAADFDSPLTPIFRGAAADAPLLELMWIPANPRRPSHVQP